MDMILLISGTINAGKSACAKALVRIWERTALVDPDHFFSFFPAQETLEVVQEVLDLTALSTCHLIDEGYDVIIPYPLWREDYEYLRKALAGVEADIHLVVLKPRIEVVLGKRSKRKNKEWERQVVEWHIDLGVMELGEGVGIDNSEQTLSQTVREIMAVVESGKAKVV